MEYDVHHLKLLLKRNEGVIGMECVLLKESDSDYSCNFNYKLLIVGKHVRTYQLYYLHK